MYLVDSHDTLRLRKFRERNFTKFTSDGSTRRTRGTGVRHGAVA